MLYRIARKLTTDYIDTLSFADRTGGLVKLMNDRRKSEKSYPIETNQNKVFGDNQYMRRLVPDSSLKSLMYWEMGSAPTTVEEHNAWYLQEAQLKLVCWFNYQKIDPDMYDARYLISEILHTIPFSIGSFECLTAVTCSFAGEDHNDGSIFSQYTYNEPESQFFKYPYDYFVLNFDISYRVVRNCYAEDIADVPVDQIVLELGSKVLSRTVIVAGVSGREYQLGIESTTTLLANTLYEFSGEDYEHTFIKPAISSDNILFSIDYGREYLRKIDASDQDVESLTIPEDTNIRIEYLDLSNGYIPESNLTQIIDHLYDTELYDGYCDVSGNSVITNVNTLAQITEMITNRGWTINYD